MSKKNATAAEKRWMGRIASMMCLLCKRFGHSGTRVHVHHIASGSGKRSNYCVVPLCETHHLHGLHGGIKTFIGIYKVPGGTEYGLLCWLLEDISATIDMRSAWNDL